MNDHKSSTITNSKGFEDQSSPDWQMDMQAKTFNVDKFSDYKVCVKDTIFQVNSVFLAIHSNVFRAYFNHNTRETQTKTIQIDDVDANLVEAMLKYCYSGKVENLAEIAQDLYVLADRYQMEELQKLCLGSIVKHLCLNNIISSLELTFRLNVVDLKEKTMDFVISNYEYLEKTPEWNEFILQNVPISLELMSHFNKQKAASQQALEDLKDKIKEVEAREQNLIYDQHVQQKHAKGIRKTIPFIRRRD